VLTVVANIHPAIKNWQLIEPFLRHLRGQHEIELIDQSASLAQVGSVLFKTVLESVERYDTGHWQLIIISEINSSAGRKRLRFTEQLNYLHDQLARPLADKGRAPARLWLVVLDAEERDGYGRPRDPDLHTLWELDAMGYLEGCSPADSDIYFVAKECEDVDTIWGWPPDLTKAGQHINNPDKEFFAYLEENNKNLLAWTEELFDKKLGFARENDEIERKRNPNSTPLMTEECLQALKKDFAEGIKRLTSVEAITNLDTNKGPSWEFKRLLIRYFGVQGFLNDFTVVRIKTSFAGDQESAYQLVQLALLIGFLIDIEENSRHWDHDLLEKGNIYTVNVDYEREILREIMEYHLACLELADSQVMGSLPQKGSVLVAAYSPEDYTTTIHTVEESLPHLEKPQGYRNNSDVGRWEDHCFSAGSFFQRRAAELRENVMKDIKNLSVVQRQDVQKESETSDIEEHYNDLRRKQNDIKQDLARLTGNSFLREDIAALWEKYTAGIDKRMAYLMAARPTPGNLLWCLLAAVIALAIPYSYLTGEIADKPDFWIWLIVPVSMVLAAVGITFLARWKALRPLFTLIKGARNKLRELEALQKKQVEPYKDYLSLIFRLLSINKVIASVDKRRQELAYDTALLHYHQAQIRNSQELLRVTMKKFGFPALRPGQAKSARITGENSQMVENRLDFSGNINGCSLYSPVECFLLLNSQRSGETCRVTINGVEESAVMIPWQGEELHLTFKNDEVFQP